MNYNKKPLNIALTLALTSMANTAIAQQTEQKAALEVIQVTAQKRVQNLQELPTAVSVFNTDSLKNKGIADIEDLSVYMPNVQISESPGSSTAATIAVRGSVTVNPAITWEPTTGVYIDGVFVSKNVGGLFDVAAIDRVEVLRGPQGTLYGKNTIGGAVSIITRKPSGELGGEVRIGTGNYGMSDVYFTADSNQINEKLSLNITANKKERDGFYDNLSTSTDPRTVSKFKKLDSTSLRVGALYDHSDDLEIYYTYDYSNKDTTPSMGQVNTIGMADDSKDRKDHAALDGVFFDRSESSGHALTLTWQSSDSLTIKSITSFREINFEDSSDYDGLDELFFHTSRDVEHKQTSQEIQFIGNSGDLNYVAGLFYFKEQSDVSNPFYLSFGTVENIYGVEATSYASFLHADYELTDKLTLAGGLRFTSEEKAFNITHPKDLSDYWFFELPYTTAKDTWENTSGMISLNYKVLDHVQTYVKLSQGWKAGGFNGEAANAEIAVKPYDPEEVLSYEWGLKSRWLDQRVQANIAAFYNDITDMQLSQFLGAYSDIQNAGAAKVKGLEIELMATISDELTVNFNYGMLDADYDTFVTYDVFTGAPNDITDTAEFPYSPKSKWSLGLNYVTQLEIGELSVGADYSFVGDHFIYHTQPSADLTRVESYNVLNARISLEAIAGSNFNASLWGKNVADEEYRMNGIPMGDATGAFIGGINYYGDPATYGVEVSYTF